MNLFLDNSIRRADRIIAVSDHTKKDIEKYLGRTEKIDVIYEGLGNRTTEKRQKPEAIRKDDRFALIVGSMMPRKNVLGMVKAFHAVEGRKGLKLFIVGHKGYGWESVRDYIAEHNMQDQVWIGGYVSDAELNWLYSNARMLLYCSFYEGFGFPPLEAMRNGIPVVASDRSCIPEISGEAALLVDPDSISQMAQAIRVLDNDETVRERLVQAGSTRVKMFSWEQTALQTEQVLKQIEKELKG